jgi:hypothetical protein
MCQPGYRYPPYQNGPFKGELIEKATREEYKINFDCIPVDRKFNIVLFGISCDLVPKLFCCWL